ncbi:MAG TPA: PQQ-binding-like beta-propeller repeat protein, partial [Ktedonobacteraceae bacterium]|nr:PQQ-binding-like beta-propeller repeat protein [Ktedonobacteraceae bacterium]
MAYIFALIVGAALAWIALCRLWARRYVEPARVLRWIAMAALVAVLVGCGGTPAQTGASATPTQSGASQASTTTTATPSSTNSGVSITTAPKNGDWTTYHNDPARTGFLANVADPHRLSQAWNVSLDGAVYGQPLVVNDHIIVATEGDTIYSLDPNSGKGLWQTNVGKPVPLSSLPCGNIDPLGITGTPAYDPATNLVFAIAEITTGAGPAHIMVGVDANTGQVKLRRSVDLPGMEVAAHQQRGSAIVYQGRVYFTYGGLDGDCANYLGRVVAVPTTGQGQILSYTVPSTREAGIWAPPGPVIDASGNIYVSVGNGEVTQGNWDHSDSVLRFSPTLQLQDGFAPTTWGQDNAADADLGSLSPVLLPNNLIFIVGKSGRGYLLHANALGGVGGQAQELQVCPSYGGGATNGSQIFLPCTNGVRE